MSGAVGIVAIQGDFDMHWRAFLRCGVSGDSLKLVKTPEDLEGVGRVVIPGGESTTVGKLMERFGLGEALRSAAKGGMPIWGTCMGMILMANEIEDYDQCRLGVLDVTVRRNAFGAQVHSFEAEVPIVGFEGTLTAVFIRAPEVVRLGPGVEVLAEFEGRIVGVRQGKLVGTSFHPELTDDTRFHEWFRKL
ncbi:MAG: pyridoxal 5'-phosphate synthase glutaminase subunit PdxT [Armatimonadetes bacterium]|nr:pyridoxal 5'-phosphate synthase glutaminase subunit PdxT [Armatimonadota bacterium]